ncbi:MAG: hypothetical protein IK007_05825 [Lachnospiraceae bacterium]|nr:hypothetical protein [Lachnospiraceae bacterium]
MITPIEMYSMVPKSQEASMIHSAANAKHAAQHESGMQEIAHQVRQNTQQIVHTTSAENPDYRYDAKEQGNGSYSSGEKKKKKKEDGSEPEKNEDKNEKKSGFDIRI